MNALIPKNGTLKAFVMIVDINEFAMMVENDSGMIAQDTRDVLSGGVAAVEKFNGEVVGFMGDAFMAILFDPEDVFHSCVRIAKDLDRVCEYISDGQEECPDFFPYVKGGPSLKIGIEYGHFDVSTIHSRFLGEQAHIIGQATVHATRIGNAGVGNRCHIGPNAAALLNYHLEGPYEVKGKLHEGDFVYYELDLGDIWKAGFRGEDDKSYWG